MTSGSRRALGSLERVVRPLVLFGCGLAFSAPAGAATLYVQSGGSGVAPCAQGNPCGSIDRAVLAASNGDTIRVAGGTYTYVNVGNTGCDTITSSAGANVVCMANKSLTIEGGYTPGTWVLNPTANPTTIDGGGTRRCIFVVGGSAPNPSPNLTLRNMTLTNGRAQVHTGDSSKFGGGLLADLASLTLQNVKFLSNQANGSSLTGAGGAAAGAGLAMRTAPGTSTFDDVLFQSNSSTGGQGTTRGGYGFGAAFIYQSTVTIEDTQFFSNTAQGGPSTGTGIDSFVRADGLGGGLAVEFQSVVTATRVRASGNTATGGNGTTHGGGAFGAGIYVEDATLNLSHSVIHGNSVTGGSQANGGFAAGGGILYFNSNGSMDGVQLLGNRSTGGASSGGNLAGSGGGGGAYLWKVTSGTTTIVVKNSVFAGNSTQNGATGTNPGGGGGGLFVQGVTADLDHTTFDDNRIGPGANPQYVGQAIAVIASGASNSSILNLDYSVVSNHLAGIAGQAAVVVQSTETINFGVGRFSANTQNTNSGGGPIPPGTINGEASMLALLDPGYVAPGSGDYHLAPGSALIDAATGSTETSDVDGQPRVDAVRDIGADEFRGAPRLFEARGSDPAQLPLGGGGLAACDGAATPCSRPASAGGL